MAEVSVAFLKFLRTMGSLALLLDREGFRLARCPCFHFKLLTIIIPADICITIANINIVI
jgi:hypothetical protein